MEQFYFLVVILPFIRPMPEFTYVSINKAVFRILAIALNTELKKNGIFTEVVTITSSFTPRTKYNPVSSSNCKGILETLL